MLPNPPKSIRLLVGFVAGATLLSALATAVLAIVMPPKPLWTLLGFEILTAVLAAMTLPAARGAYRQGPGLALTCFAGAFFTATVIGFYSGQGQLGSWFKLWAVARVGLALLLGVCAALTVLIRNPRSWGLLAKGLLLALPPLALAVLLVLGRAGFIMNERDGLAETLRIGGLMVLGVVVGGFFCASVHYVIRAFEVGRPAEDRDPAAPPAALA